MIKLVLLASLAMMIVLPLRAARHPSPRAGLKRAIAGPMLFNVVWGALLMAAFYFLLQNPELLFPESVNR